MLWLFGAAFWSGRLLYFRDLSSYYAPSYALLADALRRGSWPLWNPAVHAGEPFLFVYPPDMLLALVGGWPACLGIGPALHLWLALVGATRLARALGMTPSAAWLAGVVYGLGGFVLSLVNLVQLFEAAAWAPWVISAALALAGRPTPRRVAVLALLLALQVSTFGAEIVLQTVLAAFVLAVDASWRRPRRWLPALASGALALLLAAPALVGTWWVTQGTTRSSGFTVSQALVFSLHPGTLAEVALPRWLGNPHAFSDAAYWGRAFFPDGYPYLLSLYLGASVLLLASQAGRRPRLWLLVAAGLLLALGSYGPLALLPREARLPFRGPQKLFFLAHLGLSLLAGVGLDRRERHRPGGLARAALLAGGAGLSCLALLVRVAPDLLRGAASPLLPQLGDLRAGTAARLDWATTWMPAAVMALAAALALARGGKIARLAAVAAALDLCVVNGGVNPLSDRSFYDLRPDVSALVRPLRGEEGRLFSYGVAQTPGLRFEPVMRAARSDAWLYYLDRQSLLQATNVLDHLDGAGGVDQTGVAPQGASLDPALGIPERFGEHHRWLERAAVRWVLSFRELPPDLVVARGLSKLPEITAPLRLYELPRALPRAFFVGEYQVATGPERRRRLGEPGFDPARVVLLETDPGLPSSPAPSDARVRYRRVAADAIDLEVRSPPGLVVLVEGYHPDWRAEPPTRVLRANDRQCALVTPGGQWHFRLRFRPRWPGPAWAACGLGLAIVATLVLRPQVCRRSPAPVQEAC